jgi:hypothetical protein
LKQGRRRHQLPGAGIPPKPAARLCRAPKLKAKSCLNWYHSIDFLELWFIMSLSILEMRGTAVSLKVFENS